MLLWKSCHITRKHLCRSLFLRKLLAVGQPWFRTPSEDCLRSLISSDRIFNSFHDGGSYYIETCPLICSVNQWSGFYLIEPSVKREWIKVNNKDTRPTSHCTVLIFFISIQQFVNNISNKEIPSKKILKSSRERMFSWHFSKFFKTALCAKPLGKNFWTPKEVWSISEIDTKELIDVKAAIVIFREKSFI